MNHIKQLVFLLILICFTKLNASSVLLPMDSDGQQNHLKAYGITYWALAKNYKVNCFIICLVICIKLNSVIFKILKNSGFQIIIISLL